MQTEVGIQHLIEMFPYEGTLIQAGRNSIKKFDIDGKSISVKSFKKPHLINSFAYKYIRKSKARRSFENAEKLLSLGINTPKPIGYKEFSNLFGIKRSYYACEHLTTTVTLREVLASSECPNKEEVLQQYTAFMFELHQKGIEFIDSTPGNILLEKMSNGIYKFYLVDLNRMKFHNSPLSFFDRMKNLSKLTEETPIMHQIEKIYAKYYKQDTKHIYQTILYYRSRYNVKIFHKQYFKYQLSELKKLFIKPHLCQK
ncbi:tRNA A-37 threonylcarbamoyl transferase component Bud32 [Flavobacterium arsenatis]|uniref:tRNA A-37 threonylcarbamoyl transferase component Bud32 n=1 Tax=Flavobacterium arsenatis TaxID=1484332 RepID=A0ABU1TLC7_9FLAO|nr:lipopolysaccharide kinase InaA family protein [Flavobacterium arsenatis]MDR6966740.1 tRNA A-37 threonylcarbamoyl transferase component Bud32 [Flavobacterium arsenatis]